MDDDSIRDDLGFAVPLPAGGVRRVVSLVPSLTESVAATDPTLLVGATAWCTHPADLDVVRLRGTKNPDVEAIVNLRPDLVLATVEENRSVDVALLRAAGIPVWVSDIRTVPGAFSSLARMLAAIGGGRPSWLDAAEAAWRTPARMEPPRLAVVPIWRRPWMALGRDTFAGDVLARLGVDNALGGRPERYPTIDLTDLPPHDLVVLPDEPYAFSCDDGPEAFAPGTACACVSGRHLTWYGPSLAEAPGVLLAQLSKECSGAGNSPVRTSSA